eukprot:GHRQ01033327.1.p2 GENE.GHRQ01033327.1~~GHRQ01033327.1.p2  ORF type:complete len:109 (+),score=20.25 GHRQ01033327.1:229-555(+)
MSLIDVFLPYLPLELAHMPALVVLALRGRAALLPRRMSLQWDQNVPEFLAGEVRREAQGPAHPCPYTHKRKRLCLLTGVSAGCGWWALLGMVPEALVSCAAPCPRAAP